VPGRIWVALLLVDLEASLGVDMVVGDGVLVL
jgi:hypothetical protein